MKKKTTVGISRARPDGGVKTSPIYKPAVTLWRRQVDNIVTGKHGIALEPFKSFKKPYLRRNQYRRDHVTFFRLIVVLVDN